MLKFKVKKGDKVQVIAGKNKGATGLVLSVLRERNRIIVQGVNKIKKHTKPSFASAGGIIEMEASIHVSNVQICDPKTDKPTRVGYRILEDGTKVRFAKKSGEVLSN